MGLRCGGPRGAGLQTSYLLWGLLQEQMMTRAYGTDDQGREVFFRNSQYLVLVNRVLALVVAYIAIVITGTCLAILH